MFQIGPIGFTAPWLLVGLIALPLLFLLLRAIPPAPIRRRFPGVALLLGLDDTDITTDRTPWWLLLLRMLAVAAIIIGFAGPVLNPQTRMAGSGPLLVLADGTWADARDWDNRLDKMTALVAEAGRNGRPVAVATLTDLPADGITFQTADVTTQAAAALIPHPWEPDAAALDALNATQGDFDTYWLSDGLDRPARQDVLTALESRGDVTVLQSPRPTYAIRPATFADGDVSVTAVRTPAGDPVELTLSVIGLDPAGIERQLVNVPFAFDAGAAEATIPVDLPPELRNRVTRFELTGQRSAAAIALTDDSLKRREVGLIAGTNAREGLDVLSPLHYVREALSPTADLVEGSLADILAANPDVLVLADVSAFGPGEADQILEWVENGGMLLRFAGPRLAASDISRTDEDPLLPVRLRTGGRSVGGTMSWGEPKTLAPFAPETPFAGLVVPDEVTVTTQVVAQPDPTLASRVLAELADGTPLVTRKETGAGQIVLFHVTANAEWSNLPLSGLFVQMLERLAVSTRPALPELADLAGTSWTPESILDAFGDLQDTDTLPGVTGEVLATFTPSPDLQPGLYAGADRRIAVNVTSAETTLAPARWPAGTQLEGMTSADETDLKGWLLLAALALLAIDIIATLALSGRLKGPRSNIAAILLGLVILHPQDARAQDDTFAIEATRQVILAHVLTGDSAVDEVAEAGLYGLSDTLFRRTSIEPGMPMGVDIETDELAFFPFLYWPITPNQPIPSAAAYEKLNRYLRSGGMILFDTRDAGSAGFGTATPEGRKLQTISLGLDVPPLEIIPSDHVLTRTFYLLQEYPGRQNSPDVWVEAAPADAVQLEGMPFRNLNDGVTPVVIGGNDWAAAWAMDEYGNRMFPVGRGAAGEQQREIALRFGVNLVMHVLTGNYKSDQVHVPDLLDRLGQ